MKISVEKNVVEFVPDSEQETDQLETLWNTIVDCVKFNKKEQNYQFLVTPCAMKPRIT